MLASPGLSGYRPTGSFDWMSPVFEALQAGDTEEAARRWVETPLMKLSDPQADAAMREIVLSNSRIWSYRPDLRRMLSPPAVGRLAEIAVPTLVLIVSDDLPDTRRVSELLDEGIAGSRVVTLQGVGHLANLADPENFDAAVLSFVGD